MTCSVTVSPSLESPGTLESRVRWCHKGVRDKELRTGNTESMSPQETARARIELLEMRSVFNNEEQRSEVPFAAKV